MQELGGKDDDMYNGILSMASDLRFCMIKILHLRDLDGRIDHPLRCCKVGLGGCRACNRAPAEGDP